MPGREIACVEPGEPGPVFVCDCFHSTRLIIIFLLIINSRNVFLMKQKAAADQITCNRQLSAHFMRAYTAHRNRAPILPTFPIFINYNELMRNDMVILF